MLRGGGEPSNIAILRTTLREHAVARIGAEPAALTLGMAYGDDSAMPKTTRENYKLSGLSHLTAVSGGRILPLCFCSATAWGCC